MPIRSSHCTFTEDAVRRFLESFAHSSQDDFHNTQKDCASSDREAAQSLLLSFPSVTDRGTWEALDPELSAHVIKEGEDALSRPWSQLLASDYLAFTRTGDREHFEASYFARRKKLTALVMAECVQDQGTFLDAIIDGITLICEESSWCLPAHNSYIRDTPQLPLPDVSRPVIDLFAAETGAILALSEYLLRERLEKVSPLISDNLDHILMTRIARPYLTEHFWWMGDGTSQMLNWTPWITQNILLTIFTRRSYFLSRKQQEEILQKAALSVDYFLDEYGDDGCCSEGAQYYSHAGLCLYGCLALLHDLTESGMNDVFSSLLVRNIADYIVKMYVGNGYYINFADCSPFPGRRGAREYLFAKATGNPSMEQFAACDYASLPFDGPGGKLMPEEENLYYHLLQVFSHADMMRCAKKSSKEPLSIPDVWFASNGLMIARDDCFVLAAKAGNNADAHNHNDVGSVILYKNNKPFLIDLGVETYTQKTFSPRRYEIWAMQSQYHNLPSFGDARDLLMQKDGKIFAAKDVICTLSDDKATLSMDLAPAYPSALIRSYLREVTLQKDHSLVTITDSYDGDLPCVLSLMTYEKPVVRNGISEQHLGLQIGDLGLITACGASLIRIEILPITDPRLGICWKHECYRILLSMEKDTLSLSIS